MQLPNFIINNFCGGKSSEGGRGVPGSFKNGWGLNIHKKNANTLSANQRLKKISPDSGDHQVTDLIIKTVPVTATKSYGFGDAGNVYKIVNETVTKVYTNPNGAILDAEYFYGYLYFTTATKLGRCIETSSDWNADALPNWKTLYSYTKHPIFIVPKSDLMCIGNKRYVATLSAGEVWNNQALDLFYGWEIQCLDLDKPNLLIGAKNYEKAEMVTWDLTSESYDPVEGWEERDINAFLKAIGTTFIFAGELLYWFSQGVTDKARELPSQIRQGAIDVWKGKMLFGGINFVYSYHQRNKNYPMVLNAEYTPSPITIANIDSKSIEIGAILGRGDDFLVAWKDGETYGLDNIDPDNKAEAVYESLEFKADKDSLFRHIKILTKPLPLGCSVKVEYRVNGIGDYLETAMQDESDVFDKDDYKAGTVSVTNNLVTVMGSETSWDSSMVGRKFKVDEDDKPYEIQAVVSATELTLARAYKGTTGSGKAYTIIGETKAIFDLEGQGEVYEVRLKLYSSGNFTPEILFINNYFEPL